MPDKIITGRVIKFGDFVNTDVIAPGRWMHEGMDTLRLHTMEAIRPEFYKAVIPGDIVVAGRNFGCGSHREQATAIMDFLGVTAIVADSISRLYFRSCVAYGIPILAVPGVSGIVNEGEVIEVSMGRSEITVKNVASGAIITAPPIPDMMVRILEAGGLHGLLKQRLAEEG